MLTNQQFLSTRVVGKKSTSGKDESCMVYTRVCFFFLAFFRLGRYRRGKQEHAVARAVLWRRWWQASAAEGRHS